jgi:hypothetical protein
MWGLQEMHEPTVMNFVHNRKISMIIIRMIIAIVRNICAEQYTTDENYKKRNKLSLILTV